MATKKKKEELPEMSPVESSNLARIGYHTDSKNLYIEFHNASIYVYKKVPKHIYEELMNAGSCGKYFAETIKPNYGFSKFF